MSAVRPSRRAPSTSSGALLRVRRHYAWHSQSTLTLRSGPKDRVSKGHPEERCAAPRLEGCSTNACPVSRHGGKEARGPPYRLRQAMRYAREFRLVRVDQYVHFEPGDERRQPEQLE